MNDKSIKYGNTRLICTCVALCLLLGAFIYNFYGYVNEQERKGRNVQIQEVTERLSQITDAVVKHRLSHIKTYAGLLQIEEHSTKEDVIKELQRLNTGVKDDDIWMGVVDDRGHFYSSEGRSGRWKDFTMLIKKAPQDQVAIMKLTGHGNQQYMLFLHRLDQPLKFAKGEIKYFATAMNMSQLESSLTSESFKDSMLTFIVNHKGQRIYHYGKDENKLDTFNIFDSLGKYTVLSGDSVSELRSKLTQDKVGLTELDIQGKRYNVCSVPLKIAPWSMLVILPKSLLSGEAGLINGLVLRLGIMGLMILVLGVLVMLQRGNKEKQKLLEKALEDSERANKVMAEINEEQEAHIEEIRSLNETLQENQARLEETSAENEAQLEEITKLNKSITTQIDVITSMSKLYFSSYLINMKEDTFEEITTKPNIRNYVGNKGCASKGIALMCENLVVPEHKALMVDFTDLKTLNERLADKSFVTIEYIGVTSGWSQAYLIAGDRYADGSLKTAFFCTRTIHDEKDREFAHAKELEKALDAAEAANQAKTVFLNNMSHDIRTPMNAILGFAKLMEKELDKPEVAREHLKKIHYSGEYLLTIINNILDMARIESGRTTVDEELIDIAEAQEGVVAVFEESAKKKNISLTVSWDIQHRYVYCDYVKCQQIAVNIISNAIKYTPNGGSVSVYAEELEGINNGYTDFRFTVADTGIGMSKEYQRELFDAFTRERNTTQSKVIGTGLGMAIVKKLVDLLKGTVVVESEPGKGSTFKVTIPMRIAEAPEMHISKQEETAPLAVDLSGKRILLAEDNELNAEIATCILEDEGFIVEHAEDGIACVDMVNKNPAGYYDAILMDIQMPNLNGYGATEKIRKFADKAKATIPIIAMTANAFDEDKKKALEAGMDGFCTKPIDIEQLNKELAMVLAGGK